MPSVRAYSSISPASRLLLHSAYARRDRAGRKTDFRRLPAAAEARAAAFRSF